MKKIKRIISSVIAVIMLFTAAPVLEAEGVFDLNMESLGELQKELNPSIKNQAGVPIQKSYKGIPDCSELEKLYSKANENYKKLYDEVIKKYKGLEELEKNEPIREIKDLIKEIKQRVLKDAQNDVNFEDFKNQEDFDDIALYSYLFYDIKNIEQKEKTNNKIIGAVGMKVVNEMIQTISEDVFVLSQDMGGVIGAKKLQTMSVRAASGFVLIPYFLLIPSNSPSIHTYEIETPYEPLIINKKIFDFLENPFAKLALFHESEKDDFEKFFNINRTAAQILFDAVYIEWYISHNPTLSNMKYRIYPHTLEWKTMSSAEERKDKLHEIAEYFRAQSRQGAKEQFSKLRVGLEER